jgi:ATP-dependent DNA helicase RecG
VVIPRRVVHPGVIRLIAEADQRYQLSQRERIALGLLGQSEGLSAAELASALDLAEPAALRPWTSRLVELGLVRTTGRTRATRYFFEPALLRVAGLDVQTTLARIQPHRLRTLILEDLERFPDSGRADIHRRIGPEIHAKAITRALNDLIDEGAVTAKGVKRWRTYRLSRPQGQE